jgi:hypothetical protein
LQDAIDDNDDCSSRNGILAAANDVPVGAEKAFRSRLAHLQRSGFPAAAGVGKFARATYGLDELLQLSVVFALVQAYVPPVVARRVVTDFWPEIARLLLAVAGARDFGGLKSVPADAPLMMTIIPRALKGMGSNERVDGKGGVDQGGFEMLLHRDPGEALRPIHQAPGSDTKEKEQQPPVATISLDFRILFDRLALALGSGRNEALQASLRELDDRFGWPK